MTTDALKNRALEVLERAYAPYSGFPVAAVIETMEGHLYHGVNVENVAYPEGTCAEAGAIAAMVGDCGAAKIRSAFVMAKSSAPVPPCGGCRQKLREFCVEGAVITMATQSGQTLSMTIEELLPGAFVPAHMSSAAPQAPTPSAQPTGSSLRLKGSTGAD